jgi:hypothetical protein
VNPGDFQTPINQTLDNGFYKVHLIIDYQNPELLHGSNLLGAYLFSVSPVWNHVAKPLAGT